MAATQTLRMDATSNAMQQSVTKTSGESLSEIPRIDLAKIDNIPYYIESKCLMTTKFF